MVLPGAIPLVGLPEGVQSMVGLAGTIVLILVLLAGGSFVYKSLTGGIEWPTDEPADDDEVHRSHDDDEEWDYY